MYWFAGPLTNIKVEMFINVRQKCTIRAVRLCFTLVFCELDYKYAFVLQLGKMVHILLNEKRRLYYIMRK